VTPPSAERLKQGCCSAIVIGKEQRNQHVKNTRVNLNPLLVIGKEQRNQQVKNTRVVSNPLLIVEEKGECISRLKWSISGSARAPF